MITYKEWRKPFEDKAKSRDVKLSNKNLARLKDSYIDWALETYGNNLNTLLKAVYADFAAEMVLYRSSILKEVSATDTSMWYVPCALPITDYMAQVNKKYTTSS